jgi:uncharacterized protein (DUF433 family)
MSTDGCRITRKDGVACGRWCVNGVPIFALRNRWRAGDTLKFLAGDYDIPSRYIQIAIDFYERIIGVGEFGERIEPTESEPPDS